MANAHNIEIDFDKTDEVSVKLNDLIDASNNLKSSYQVFEINKVYSKTAGSIVDEAKSLLNKIISGIKDTKTSYDASVKLWKETAQKLGKLVKGSTTKYTLSQDQYNELTGMAEFNFNYPKAAGKLKQVSKETLANVLNAETLKNKNVLKTNNSNIYKIKLGGVWYTYNIKTNRLYGKGQTAKTGVTCKFYTSDGTTDFSKITNTITFLSGSGSRQYGPKAIMNDPSKVGINDNSLFTIVYGGYTTSDKSKDRSYNYLALRPDMVSASTRLGDVLAGESSGKKVYNSLVGFSEGAISSSNVITKNPGLYKTVVVTNGFLPTKSLNLSNPAYKDVEFIFLESKNNKDWNANIVASLKKLKSSGIKNVTLYTNDAKLQNQAKSVIGANQVKTVTDSWARTHGKWSKHGDGYYMVKNSNMFSYLSNKKC